MNVRVEYECIPIRHIAVQCPICERWFNGRDITENKITYAYEIYKAKFHCPFCDRDFNAYNHLGFSDLKIEEMTYPEIYKDCLKKKVMWE